MSFKNLGNKQTIVFHNCEIDNKKYKRLVITPHTQTVVYIRTKRQTIKRKIINKQRQITRKSFSKNRNAFSESEANSLDELYKLKESIDKNCPIHDQLNFSDSETTSNSSKKGKKRTKKQYKHKPVHLYNWNQPFRQIDSFILTVIKRKMSHTQSDDSPDDQAVFPFLIDSLDDRGQHDFCKNLLVNLFEPGISPCIAEFPDVKIKRQIIEHYLKDICNLTQQYGIYTIEFSTSNTTHRKYVIQTDDFELEFSKVFIEYIKNIQYHNSQRANSIFTNEVFAIIYSYISILEKTKVQSISPTETSKHTKVRNEITIFSTFLHVIRENFNKEDVSQNTKHDLQKILAWFIIDYFTHNLDLISQARKNFRPQNTNDDTALSDQSDYVWDPEWSHYAFLNIPQGISSQAISTISYHKDYVKVVPLTIDATPLNYNTFLPDTRNNSLNSTVINNESLNGTRNLTQQDIQTPSHFINEEIVQTTTTTTQQSVSPIHPNLTTPRNTNTSLTQVTLQSTVKPSVAPKYSHMDYQTYRPMTMPSKHENRSQEILLQNTIIIMLTNQEQTNLPEKIHKI